MQTMLTFTVFTVQCRRTALTAEWPAFAFQWSQAVSKWKKNTFDFWIASIKQTDLQQYDFRPPFHIDSQSFQIYMQPTSMVSAGQTTECWFCWGDTLMIDSHFWNQKLHPSHNTVDGKCKGCCHADQRFNFLTTKWLVWCDFQFFLGSGGGLSYSDELLLPLSKFTTQQHLPLVVYWCKQGRWAMRQDGIVMVLSSYNASIKPLWRMPWLLGIWVMDQTMWGGKIGHIILFDKWSEFKSIRTSVSPPLSLIRSVSLCPPPSFRKIKRSTINPMWVFIMPSDAFTQSSCERETWKCTRGNNLSLLAYEQFIWSMYLRHHSFSLAQILCEHN